MPAGKLLIFAASFTLTCAFFLNFCDLLFACGCRSLWAEAADHCNVHQHQGRRCPFCTRGLPGYSAVFAAMVLPQAWISFRKRPMRWQVRLAAAIAAFPVTGIALGLAMGIYDGYWNG